MKVGYSRVSTSDQNSALQLDALKKAGCERIFDETASGAKQDRPELAKALEYCRDGDVLVVWKLDRLARSLKQLIATVEELENRGIQFQSITEGLDTTSAGGKLVFHIMGALAEFERNLIRERTIAGLESARQRGRLGGRPRALDDRDIVAAKALLADESLSVNDVAQRLKVSPATIYRHLPGGKAALAG